jgi:L-iditol 2-dehydrogenase
MKASRLHGARDLRLEDVAEPVLAPGEALIRVRAMGVCGSDLHLYKGDRVIPYPHILGHEFAGDIVQVGANVSHLQAGQRVTSEPNFWCGNCVYCLAGDQNLCLSRIPLGVDIDGAQAEYVKVPARFVWTLPDSVSYTQGALVEPLTVSLHCLRKSRAQVGDTVAIMGCGSIGLLALLCAKAAGCRVVAVDVVPHRLEFAKKLGADEIINSRESDLVDAVKQLTGGLGPEVVLETAGVSPVPEQAVAMVRSGGRVMFVGLTTQPAQFAPITVVRREVEISGSYIYRAGEFGQTIRLMSTGQINVLPLIGLTAGLAEAQEVYEQLLAGKAVKGLITM